MKKFIGQKCKFHFRKDSCSLTSDDKQTIAITAILAEVKNGLFITEKYIMPIESISYVELA